jgi:hypothetical protein
MDDVSRHPMPHRALNGIISGAITGGLAALLSAAARCIDSPAYYNLWPLLSASGGVAMIVTSLGPDMHRGVRLVLHGIGIILVAAAVLMAPFKACAQILGPAGLPTFE